MVTRILIVEDVAALRQHAAAIAKAIAPAVIEIVEASNGAEGLKLARSIEPDLIIMDISMPEMSGIKAAKEIWAEYPMRRILFWSQFHREAYVRELGKIVPDDAIHGYALKSETDEKLSYAISSILLHDNPYIDPVVRNVQARVQSREDSLTDVEYETLLDVVVGLTDKAIAARRHISVRGVQNRLSMLLEKLVKGEDAHLRESAEMEVFNPRTRIVFEAVKRGLLDPDEISRLERDLAEWLAEEYSYEPA
jgi:DNA-binding NarL/FixJ family response regulator